MALKERHITHRRNEARKDLVCSKVRLTPWILSIVHSSLALVSSTKVQQCQGIIHPIKAILLIQSRFPSPLPRATPKTRMLILQSDEQQKTGVHVWLWCIKRRLLGFQLAAGGCVGCGCGCGAAITRGLFGLLPLGLATTARWWRCCGNGMVARNFSAFVSKGSNS